MKGAQVVVGSLEPVSTWGWLKILVMSGYELSESSRRWTGL